MDRGGELRYGRWLVIGAALTISIVVHALALLRPPPGAVVVPVLMYHHVREPGPSMADAMSRRYAVSPVEFEKQLDRLLREGYTTIDTRALDRAMNRGEPLPAKPVMLTFDDGWETQYSIVYPLLKARGMVGVFFVHTGALTETEGAAMTWSQVCRMEEDGMDIESHTLSHPSLPRIAEGDLAKELTESRSLLESRLGREVRAVAYPFGDFTEREVAAVARAGYRLAFSTEVGTVQALSEPLEIHRTIITFNDTLDDFAIKLNERDGARALLDYLPSIVPAQRTARVE